MKSLQKLILPVLIVAAFLIIYFFYFAPKDTLGNFSSFDPNNTATKDIKVKVVTERGIQSNMQGTMFYAVDAKGVEVYVQGPPNLENELKESGTVTLRGHLHNDYFHASEVMLD